MIDAARVGGKRGKLWAPIDAEDRVLAVVLASRAASWPDGIGPASFYSGRNARIWRAMTACARPFGWEEVMARLAARDNRGGQLRAEELQALASVLDRVPAGSLDFAGDVATVRAAAARRELASRCDQWAARLRHTDEPVAAVLEEAWGAIDALSTLARPV